MLIKLVAVCTFLVCRVVFCSYRLKLNPNGLLRRLSKFRKHCYTRRTPSAPDTVSLTTAYFYHFVGY